MILKVPGMQSLSTQAWKNSLETKEDRDIGVIVSSNMKPTAQCLREAKTAQTVLGQLSRAFHYSDRHVFMRLYKSSSMYDHTSNSPLKLGPPGLKETGAFLRKFN